MFATARPEVTYQDVTRLDTMALPQSEGTDDCGRHQLGSTCVVPSGYASALARAASTARRVLPDPPAPVSVRRRVHWSKRRISTSSDPRPTSWPTRDGQRSWAYSFRRARADLGHGTGLERCTRAGVQAEAHRQPAHGGRSGRPSSAALQIGDPASAEAGAFGELLLREASRHAQTSQQDTKGA
jgi:hypothetical protein